MLVLLKRRIKKIIEFQKWNYQIRKRCKIIHSEEKQKCIINGEKIIYIVPHSDDELISGYNFIKRYGKNILLVYCGFLGEKKSEQIMGVRKQEFLKSCTEMNVEYELISGNIEDELSEIVNRFKPQYICIPSYIDWHFEHRRTNDALRSILSINKDVNVVWYQISVPIPISFANCIVTFSKKDQKKKYDLFRKVYLSQQHIPINRFIKEEKFCGKYYECYAAERFMIMKYSEFCEKIDKLKKSESEIQEMKKDINDLYIIYNKSERLYRNFAN